jgi:Domain of unknown function (DUF4349)
MQTLWQKKKRYPLWLCSFVFFVLIFAGCAGSASSTNGATYSAPNTHASSLSTGASSSTNSSSQDTTTSDVGPQYLIKTLNVDMQVKDTRKVANSIQAWITATDPRASSSGTNYEQAGNNLYDISLSFSVQATIYPQIYQYLRDYTINNDGQLVKFNESVQDVTNTYVDMQSRLQNLRVEQGRLQNLLNQAQNLNDILTVQQKLTDVEGQIETDEAQLNTLTSQVTFYTVSISLEPIAVAPPPLAQTNGGWSITQVFHDAFTASLALGEGLIAFIVWLLAFSLYIIPIAVIAWFGHRWYKRSTQIAQPKVATGASPQREE